MRFLALMLLLISASALAGGHEPTVPPPLSPFTLRETGRSIDRAYAGRIQVFQNALLEAAHTTLAQSKNPEVQAVAREIIRTHNADQKQLQAFQRAWKESVGAYGIVDILGPNNERDRGSVDHWFLHVAIEMQKTMLSLSGQAIKQTHRAEVKSFARSFTSQRTSQNTHYMQLLKDLK